MHKVIKHFTDLQDKEYPYNVGDTFPREGVEVTEDRIKALSGDQNKQGEPLIEFVEEKAGDDAAEESAIGEQETDSVDAEPDEAAPEVKKKTAANKRTAKNE